MMINKEFLIKFTESCDERIKSLEEKITNMSVFKLVLDLCSLEMEERFKTKIQNYKNSIKLIQVEKLIYLALSKNDNSAIFPKLLLKYDELMSMSYDLSNNLVIEGLVEENDYLEFCKDSLNQREYIRKLCSYGEYRH